MHKNYSKHCIDEQKSQELYQTINQIHLINLFQTTDDITFKIQILSRLKQILLKIPNSIENDPSYISQCNDRYFNFVISQINKGLGRAKPEHMRFLFRVVSLRIKYWFNKKDFDDIFSSFMLSVEHNRRIIPYFIEFLIELVDAFQIQDFTPIESIPQNYNHNQLRLSLTHKTNSKFFTNNNTNRKVIRATKQLNQLMNTKRKYNKQNRFQRQFLDFQLNKILIFANQIFNKVVVENENFNFQDEMNEVEQDQQMYFIKAPFHTITKNLLLIHKILTFDFFGDRTIADQDQYFNQRMPLIIPTKYSKLCQYHQFQNWIKNKNDFYKYQYLYFWTNNPDLKTIIVRILGDQLRIHQKFFRKQMAFKTHLEGIITPLKTIIQGFQIRDDSQYELALIIGQNLNKILIGSTFPTFLNLIKNECKLQFCEQISQAIKREIIIKSMLDASLIKYYFGFFVELLEKLQRNSNHPPKIQSFKQEILNIVNNLGQAYQDQLYRCSINGMHQNQNELQVRNVYGIHQSIVDLNLTYFQVFMSIFKFFTPAHIWTTYAPIEKKIIFLCSKLENGLSRYEIYSRKQFISNTQNQQIVQIQSHERSCTQSLQRLTEVIKSHIKASYRSSYQVLKGSQYSMMGIIYFLQKLLNCRSDTILIFNDEDQTIFKFTTTSLQMVLKIKELQAKMLWDQNQMNPFNNVIISSQLVANSLVKLNEQFIAVTQNEKHTIQQINRDISINRVSMNTKQYLSLPFNRENKYDKKEILEGECSRIFKELRYYQTLIKIIFHLQKNINNKQNNLRTPDLEYYDQSLVEGLISSIAAKKYQEIIEPIYYLYFSAITKCQNHRKQHKKFIQSLMLQKQNKNKGKAKCFLQQDQELSFNQNDDQCTVIEEEQYPIVDINSIQCLNFIEYQDINDYMTSVGYFVLFNYSQNNSEFRESLNKNFYAWYHNQLESNPQENKQQIRQAQIMIQMKNEEDENNFSEKDEDLDIIRKINSQNNKKNTEQNFVQNQKGQKKQHGQNKLQNYKVDRQAHQVKQSKQAVKKDSFKIDSFYKIFQLQHVLKRLFIQYFIIDQINWEQDPEIKGNRLDIINYSVKCASFLLKKFINLTYEIDIKQQIIKICDKFIVSNFKTFIIRNQYWNFQRQEHIVDVLQSIQNLIKIMINSHYKLNSKNIFNQQFGLVFEKQFAAQNPQKLQIQQSQHNQNKNANQIPQNTVLNTAQAQNYQNLPQHQNQYAIDQNDETQATLSNQTLSKSIIKTFRQNQDICNCFDTILNFILDCPLEKISQGYYSEIQNVFLNLYKEIYDQFAQFLNIYLLESSISGSFQLKISESPRSSLQKIKYVIHVDQQSLGQIAHGYITLIKFVDKSMKISFQFKNKDWIVLRNKYFLPFMNQIIFFLEKLKQNQDFLDNLSFNIQAQSQIQTQVKQTEQKLLCMQSQIKKLLNTFFQFTFNFLSNLEENQIQFVTKNLSFIQSIYRLVDATQQLKNNIKLAEYIESNIQKLNQIIIFKCISIESKENCQKQNEKVKKEQIKPRKYKGWEYIKRLYEINEDVILQQLQNYQLKFKYYTKCQRQSYQEVLNDKQAVESARKSTKKIQQSRKSLSNQKYPEKQSEQNECEEQLSSQKQDSQSLYGLYSQHNQLE